jgi:hypothetical protein
MPDWPFGVYETGGYAFWFTGFDQTIKTGRRLSSDNLTKTTEDNEH